MLSVAPAIQKIDQGQQRDHRAVEHRQLVHGRAAEQQERRPLLLLEAAAGEPRVGEGQPVGDQGDDRADESLDIRLPDGALGRQQRGHEDRPVDEAGGVLGNGETDTVFGHARIVIGPPDGVCPRLSGRWRAASRAPAAPREHPAAQRHVARDRRHRRGRHQHRHLEQAGGVAVQAGEDVQGARGQPQGDEIHHRARGVLAHEPGAAPEPEGEAPVGLGVGHRGQRQGQRVGAGRRPAARAARGTAAHRRASRRRRWRGSAPPAVRQRAAPRRGDR